MRTNFIRYFALCMLFGSTLVVGVDAARAQGASTPADQRELKSEVQGNNRREITAPVGAPVPELPTISFIDSPTGTCYQPDRTQDVCYINWYYLSVGADPSYLVWMQAEINVLGKVARYQGFFQTAMYVPYAMHDRGFKVPCGALGSSTEPELGASYAYTIRARDSAGLGTANYGTVFCPAYIP
jgi:hypothetical protein